MSEAIQKIISNQENTEKIRNICILAHIDHGKTTLADQLISSNRIISNHLAGKIRYMDSREDEQDKGITMKSSAISLLHEYKNLDGTTTSHSIYLIDSPGHVDFSIEVSSAARLSDGAIIVVDAVEGVCTQTRTVLFQAFKEGIELILVINKIDKLLILKKDPMEFYNQIERIISQVNALMTNYHTKERVDRGEDIEEVDSDSFFHPGKGNVVFSCAFDGWGFRIKDFAKIFSQTFGMKESILQQTLWGRYYYNAKKKAIKSKPSKDDSPTMFASFIARSLFEVYTAVLNNDIDKLKRVVTSMKLNISPRLIERKTEDEKSSQQKFSLIMREWLPLENAILDTVIEYLPNPIQVQKNRIVKLIPDLENLGEMEEVNIEDLDKKYLIEMRNHRRKLREDLIKCNHSSDAISLAFISKMINMTKEDSVFDAKERFNQQRSSNYQGNDQNFDEIEEEKSELVGFARVFSGRLFVGQEIHVLGPRYNAHKPDEYRDVKKITSLYLMMGKDMVPVKEVFAGNICAIGGLDDVVLKSATLSTSSLSPVFSAMYFQAHPIIKIAVETENVFDAPALTIGLQMLNKADPSVIIYTQQSGEHVIMTAGEVHAERCITDLKEKFAKIPLIVSPPLVSFKETIVHDVNNPSKVKSSKTSNRQLKIYIKTIPLPENISTFLSTHEMDLEKIASGDFDLDLAEKNGLPILHKLKEQFEAAGKQWASEWKNVWSIGPRYCGPNVLLNHIPLFNTHFRSIEDRFIHPSYKISSDIEDAYLKKLLSLESGFISGFQLATKEGPLCAEPMFGVCFEVVNVEIFDLESETTNGQVISAISQACRKAFDCSARRLVEAMYLCELILPQESVGPACSVLKQRRADIIDQDIEEGTGQFIIKCHLPIVESFGFTDELRNDTSGECTPNIEFGMWKVLDVDPFKKMVTEEEIEEFGDIELKDNIALKYINLARKRKGLLVEELLVDEGEKNRNLSRKK